MAALGWLMNLDFAGGAAAVEAPAVAGTAIQRASQRPSYGYGYGYRYAGVWAWLLSCC